MNLGQYVYKRSSFDRILNWILVGNLILALVLASVVAIGYHGWAGEKIAEGAFYIFYDHEADDLQNIGWTKAWFRVYLIVNSFVPLDLLAMLEISKLVYTPQMENDAEMVIVDPTVG